MGVMTRLEMQNEIADNVGRSDLGTEIAIWLYRAVLDLGTYHKFYENRKNATVSLTTGNSSATAPTDLIKPVRMEYDDSSTISVLRFKDLIYVRENFSHTPGLPDFFGREGGNFLFNKEADDDYSLTLYYRFRPTDFTGDASTSPYGGEWDEALLLWATSRAFKRIREPQMADYYLKQYYSYVKGRLGDMTLSEEAYNETLAGDSTEDPYGF